MLCWSARGCLLLERLEPNVGQRAALVLVLFHVQPWFVHVPIYIYLRW